MAGNSPAVTPAPPDVDLGMSELPMSGRLATILKAYVVGADVDDAASRATEPTAFGEVGALEPPYDPAALCQVFEHSNSLRPNVDAYCTNIDGFGHRYEPVIDFDAEDAARKVADCLRVERAWQAEQGTLPAELAVEPSKEEIQDAITQLAPVARAERARLEAFFDSCCFQSSFIGLRRRTRQDLEVTGNAYWEVLRARGGQLARFVHVPSHTVRLLPLDPDAVEVSERVRVSPILYDRIVARRRMRRLVQLVNSQRVYFKAFGDPRVISRKTGQVFGTVEELRERDETDAPATEVLHFAIPSPRSPYGVPRWVGALLSVLGSREMEEVNYLYFGNKSVPPLAILVSNGRLSESAVPRLERFIEENLKGKKGFHKVLIVEADGAGTGDSRAKIEMVPLTQAQQADQLFGAYDQANVDKVGAAFRLPRILRGDSRDMNRSTAETSLRLAEEQVFQPERDELDDLINRVVLGELGIRFWRFRSNAPLTRDPERMTEMVERLVRVGVLTPAEGRQLAGDIFNREFKFIADDWTRRPITLTLAGIQTGVGDLKPQVEKSALLRDAGHLVALHEELQAEQERLTARRMELARRYAQAAEADDAVASDLDAAPDA
jgi:PBSX family phage portal protein